MMWGQCGDDRDEIGMMGTTGTTGTMSMLSPLFPHRPQWRQWRPQPWGPHGDLLGAMGMTWGWQGWCRDDGTMWGWRGWHLDHRDHGDNIHVVPIVPMLSPVETTKTTAMGTTWRPSGGYGDDVGTTGKMWGWWDDVGMTWGQCGPCGDNEITKNAITFEQIEIIEFHLKIWDPWALPHTYRLHLMYSWGCPITNDSFIQKLLLWLVGKFFSCFCTGSH